MKRSDQDQLLQELLTDEAWSKFRGDSLEQTVRALRQRQRTRRFARFGLLALAPVLVSLGLWINFRTPNVIVTRQGIAAPPHVVEIMPARPAEPVEQITKEELLALFPGRALALIGPPGEQQLIFFDSPPSPQLSISR